MLGRHHDIGAAIGFARDAGHLRHRRFGIGEQQLRAVLDDAAMLLRRAGQEAGHVDEGHDGNVEGIAETHEARCLAAGVAVDHAREHQRLIGDEADRVTFQPPEADDHVARERFADFEEIALVHHLMDQFLDVIGLVGAFRHQRVERIFPALGIVFGRPMRRLLAIVERQEIVEPADFLEAYHIVLIGPVGNRGLRRVHFGAAEFFRRHVLVGHGFRHVRPGDEHVRAVAHHEDEIGQRGRIDVAARARPHDDGNLRHDARRQHIALEDFAEPGQRGHAFLNARAARIVEPDDRRAVLHRHVLDLADLLCMRFRQRAAEHGEVLGEDIGHAPVDRAPARDHAVARNARFVGMEIGVAVFDEHIELFERALIEQELDAFARGELALVMLLLYARLAAA